MKKLTFISIVFFFLLITPKNIYAQWSNDPNQNLRISNFGYFVDACEDGLGGAFVGWKTGNTEYPTVWLQWIDKYGYIKWNQPINIKSEGEAQESFKLIRAENGRVIIAFIDQKVIGPPIPPNPFPQIKSSIILQKVDTTATLLWGEKGVNVTTDTLSLTGILAVVPDGTDGAYITWEKSYGEYNDDSTITRIQRISYDGQRLWGDEGKYITTWYGVNAPYPSLGERKPDGVFLLYTKVGFLPTIVSIDPDNSIRWEKTNKWYPFDKLVPDENGGAAWARTVYPEIWDSGYTLIANRMNANGDLLWGDSGIVLEKRLPSGWVADVYQKFFKDGSFLIYHDTYLQMINSDGELRIKNPISFGDTTKRINGYGIFSSDSTNIIIAWGEDKNELYQYKCQKFSETFEKLWDVDVLYSESGHPSQAYISDDRRGFIGVFSVYYPDTPGILVQQVSSNGLLGEVLTTVKEDNISISKDFHLYQNYPNPFNPSTIISYQLPATGFVTLKVYDILGNEVTTLVDEEKPTGSYQVVFLANGENKQQQLSSGVYFIELKINHSKRELIKCILLK